MITYIHNVYYSNIMEPENLDGGGGEEGLQPLKAPLVYIHVPISCTQWQYYVLLAVILS